MSRFLSTIPTNHGFVGLDNVEAYPTGGSGPTAFGPTSYFGSDPRPPEVGDNLNNPIDLGRFDPLFSTRDITGTHGGLTRRQSTFYKFKLLKLKPLPSRNHLDGIFIEDSMVPNLLNPFNLLIPK